MPVDLLGRSFLTLLDFTPEEIRYLLDFAHRLKRAKAEGTEDRRLAGKNIALIFEKSSTRTRCAFEVAAFDQGAHVTYLGPSGSHLGQKESVADTAQVLGRLYHGIEYRGFGQDVVETLAAHAGVPVWNGLTDDFHPTQVLADLMTMQEHGQKPLEQMALAYLGDGANNVARSLMVGSAKLGIDFRIAAPEACRPPAELIERCRALSEASGARLTLTADLAAATAGADFLYTDVWVSMGDPESAWDERIALLRPYQVNRAAIDATGNPRVRFLHCLPAFHDRNTAKGEAIFERYGLDGLEVTDKVFSSEHSVVFDQAENRLHTIKALMVATLAA